MGSAIGIDLGTSNSVVAHILQGKPQVIPDEYQRRLIPSVVCFTSEKEVYVGADAKAQAHSYPLSTVSSVKRLMGRKFKSEETKKTQKIIPIPLVEGIDQNTALKIDNEIYSPQEISAFILRHLKNMASRTLNEEIFQTVVTVPAYFNDNQRQATKDACKIAGLQTLRIINEPTAAALAYGFGKKRNETIAIYDLGGGTFDISILSLKDKVLEVVSTAGDSFLGGDDFDERLITLMIDHFHKKTGMNLRNRPHLFPLLKTHAEKAKQKLSYMHHAEIIIPAIIREKENLMDFQFQISRVHFQEATFDLVKKTFGVCEEALQNASLKPADLDAVILVGGATKMPIIYDAVHDFFGKCPLRDHNPDEVVALGAAIQAEALKSPAHSKSSLLLDVTPLDLGIATVGGYWETIIEKNCPIPTQASRTFTTTKDFQKTVSIRILQGKTRKMEEATILGEFEFSGFKTGKAGEASIEVTFSINPDGIVEAKAKDCVTGVQQSLQVKLTATLSTQAVEAATGKIENFEPLQLKDPWMGTQKALIGMLSKRGPMYEEGFVRDFNPFADEFKIYKDNPLKSSKTFSRDYVAWILLLDDFADIPRYLNILTTSPLPPPYKGGGEGGGREESQPQAFKLKDGSVLHGKAENFGIGDLGFWISPCFPEEEHFSGKLYLYTSALMEGGVLHGQQKH